MTFDDAASATPVVTIPALALGTELTFTLTVTGRGGSLGTAPDTDTATVTVFDPTAGICGRTEQVRDAIVARISGVDNCADVTATQLAAITTGLSLNGEGITALAAGDFDGLTGVPYLDLQDNELTELPAGVFDDLTSLQILWLLRNSLSTLSAGVFDGLTSLTALYLSSNELTTLPAGVFDGLTSLTNLFLTGSNELTELPAGVFDDLTSLTNLVMHSNGLTSLPTGVFDNLTALTDLSLNSNGLTSLPTGVFDNLTALTDLSLNSNGLTSLPTGVFDNLTSLQQLWLDNNDLTELPAGVFDDLTALTELRLYDNQLDTLPANVFAGLTSLTKLDLHSNELDTLPDGVFEPLTSLTSLQLSDNDGAPFSPEAVARPDDGTVPVAGGMVPLDGSGSGGAWGTNVTYGWALTDPASGVTVTFDNDASPTPEVTIPALMAGTALTFTLTVTGRGAGTGTAPDTDTAIVTAMVPNTAPNATDATASTDEDAAYDFDAGDFNFTDTDTGDTLASVKITSLPASGKGSLTLDGSAVSANQVVSRADIDADKLVYTPPANANGDDYASFGFKVSDGTDETTSAYTMTIDVTAVNDAATGAPAISGTARVGSELSAAEGTIADVDGLTSVSYSYQWIRVDGTDEMDITGAASSTYTLVAADQGKKVKVRLGFTDDDGTGEARTSAAYTVTMTGFDPTAGICGRTEAVRIAILALISDVTNCADVTDAHLAAITGTLDLFSAGTSSVQAGDFDGLTALTVLDLRFKNLASLPDGVFDELTALTDLDLGFNSLTTLPAGVFDELTALTGLGLSDNSLTTLPAGVFDELTALTGLGLSDNSLTTLPAGVFDELTALTTLWLQGNPGAPFAPTAVALPDDGTVSNAGGTVTLDGSGSGGPWGTNVTYSWSQTSGPTSGVTFDDATSAKPVVTIPALTDGAELTFTLTVTGRGGPLGAAPDTDTATVTATAPPASDDATLESLTVSDGTSDLTLAPPFAPGTFVYAAEVANAVTMVTLTAETTDDGASVSAVTLAGTAIADNDFTDGIMVPSLVVGDNAIMVRVTVEDTTTTQTYEVTVTRPAAPGVTVSTTALTVTEQDTTGDSYTVVLDTEPTADVTVTVAGHAGTDVTPNPATLTFASTTWSTAQTVTVTAGDDADTTDDSVTLTHSAASTDNDYGGITIDEVAVTVSDNDTARVTGVSVTSGNAQLVVNWTAVDNATGLPGAVEVGRPGLQHHRPAVHGHLRFDHEPHDHGPGQRHRVHGAGERDADRRQRRPAVGAGAGHPGGAGGHGVEDGADGDGGGLDRGRLHGGAGYRADGGCHGDGRRARGHRRDPGPGHADVHRVELGRGAGGDGDRGRRCGHDRRTIRSR